MMPAFDKFPSAHITEPALQAKTGRQEGKKVPLHLSKLCFPLPRVAPATQV